MAARMISRGESVTAMGNFTPPPSEKVVPLPSPRGGSARALLGGDAIPLLQLRLDLVQDR
jgi:hypothetical protein